MPDDRRTDPDQEHRRADVLGGDQLVELEAVGDEQAHGGIDGGQAHPVGGDPQQLGHRQQGRRHARRRSDGRGAGGSRGSPWSRGRPRSSSPLPSLTARRVPARVSVRRAGRAAAGPASTGRPRSSSAVRGVETRERPVCGALRRVPEQGPVHRVERRGRDPDLAQPEREHRVLGVPGVVVGACRPAPARPGWPGRRTRRARRPADARPARPRTRRPRASAGRPRCPRGRGSGPAPGTGPGPPGSPRRSPL